MREEYRKTKNSINCTLNKGEFKVLKTNARKYSKKPTSFLRESALNYIQQKYLVPEDIQENFERFINLTWGIARNINQIAKHSNTVKSIWIINLVKVKNLIHRLEKEVSLFIHEPSRQW